MAARKKSPETGLKTEEEIEKWYSFSKTGIYTGVIYAGQFFELFERIDQRHKTLREELEDRKKRYPFMLMALKPSPQASQKNDNLLGLIYRQREVAMLFPGGDTLDMSERER